MCIIVMIHEQAVEEVKVPHFPLDPESSLKQSWDLFIMIFLMYTTFSVPYMLAFVQPPEIQPGEAMQAEISAFDVFEILLDCLFCTDVCLNFCTAFTDKGVYHTSLKVIAQHYLKTWFFLDFFATNTMPKIARKIDVKYLRVPVVSFCSICPSFCRKRTARTILSTRIIRIPERMLCI